MSIKELIAEAVGAFTDKEGRVIHASLFGITNSNQLVALFEDSGKRHFVSLEKTSAGFIEKDTVIAEPTKHRQEQLQLYNHGVSEDDCISGVFEVPNYEILCLEGHYYSAALEQDVQSKLIENGLLSEDCSQILVKVLKIGKIDPTYPKRTHYVMRDRGNILYTVTGMSGKGLTAISCKLIGDCGIEEKIKSMGF